MAMENWISGAEMQGIAMIVNAMEEAKVDWDAIGAKTGGDVLRIPMGKLKKAGYKFLGCDIDEDGKNFEKLKMEPIDNDDSIHLLTIALDKVIAEIEGIPVTTEEELKPPYRIIGKYKVYSL